MNAREPSLPLTDDDLPGVLACADRSSTRAQRHFLIATAVTLSLMAIAAIMGAVDKSWSAWVGAGAFLAAIALGALAVVQNLQRTWYDGRALAESARSLSWLYMVRGGALSGSDDKAAETFTARLRGLSDELRDLAYVLPTEGPEITLAMRALRDSPLPARRTTYDRARLADQVDYYRRRGADHRRHARRFQIATWSAQLLGFGGALLRATDLIQVDLLGIGAACAAGLTAWLQTRDHVTTARAYELTAEDLDRVRRDAPDEDDEATWGAFVAGAETAMSREHVMWIARRGRLRRE